MERRETKMIIDSTQVNSKKDELKNDLLEERIKRRKDNISQVLYTKRKVHQMQFQPFEDIINKVSCSGSLEGYPKRSNPGYSDRGRISTRSDREETLLKSK